MSARYEYMALIMIPAKNNTGTANHCLDLIARLDCLYRWGKDLAGITVVDAERYGASAEGVDR